MDGSSISSPMTNSTQTSTSFTTISVSNEQTWPKKQGGCNNETNDEPSGSCRNLGLRDRQCPADQCQDRRAYRHVEPLRRCDRPRCAYCSEHRGRRLHEG